MGIDNIKEKIMKLLAKAGDAACTAEEADTALTMAKKLMDKYGVSDADLENAKSDDWKEEAWGARQNKKGQWIFHPVDRYALGAVAKFCGCRAWKDRSGTPKAVFFGMPSDIELANWMRVALIQQFDKDWATYKNMSGRRLGVRGLTEARLAFSQGFCSAVQERLTQWQFRHEASDSNALIVVKQDAINKELAVRGISFTSSAAPPRAVDTMAYGAGVESGRAAGIGGKGVNGGRQILLG